MRQENKDFLQKMMRDHSVFSFPIHDYPNDYWRFTPECFRMLLKDMGGITVEQSGGGENSPEGVYGFGIKK